jgi:FG-GAP-like repeat
LDLRLGDSETEDFFGGSAARALCVLVLLSGCPRTGDADGGTSDSGDDGDAGFDGGRRDGGQPWAVSFSRRVLDPRFLSEGVTSFDVDGDGQQDLVAGDQWFDLATGAAHAIGAVTPLDPPTQYSASFLNFDLDVDGDGRVDQVVFGFPLAGWKWRRNPGDGGTPWAEYPLGGAFAQESPVITRLRVGGPQVAVFQVNPTQMGVYTPGADPTQPWVPEVLELPAGPMALAPHGLGIGDLDGDGRRDIITPRGFWSQPSAPDGGWDFHAFNLGPDCAQMQVGDFNGDGLADLATSSAHGIGVWWHEQKRDGGSVWFERHDISAAFSQSHALELADLNGDGLVDVVTGKRMYAHPPGVDVDSEGARVLYWFEQTRGDAGTSFIPHRIDADSGVGTQFIVRDLNGDGRPDIAVSNKRGLHYFEQQ